MDNHARQWLADVVQAVQEIQSFVATTQDYEAFVEDLKTRKAVERNIEIIGEAVRRLVAADPAIGISHVRAIIDTRNRIAHAYDQVSEDILWTIVVRHLPQLLVEVQGLLKSYSG